MAASQPEGADTHLKLVGFHSLLFHLHCLLSLPPIASFRPLPLASSGFLPVCFYQFFMRICGAPHIPADQFAQVDVNGLAWVAGYTSSSLDGHRNAGGWDIFLMKFDGEGVHQWTHQRGGEGDDVARALQADGVRCPSFSICFHGGKHQNSLRCPCSSSPFKFNCSTCWMPLQGQNPGQNPVFGGSLSNVLGLKWIESTEWYHV